MLWFIICLLLIVIIFVLVFSFCDKRERPIACLSMFPLTVAILLFSTHIDFKNRVIIVVKSKHEYLTAVKDDIENLPFEIRKMIYTDIDFINDEIKYSRRWQNSLWFGWWASEELAKLEIIEY